MDKITDVGEPASELERLIADLSESGLLVFVFGDGLSTAHLAGVTRPLFRGPADRRWWHVHLGDDTANWTMDVRVDEITAVQFVRAPYPFLPSFPGQEVLTVQFLGSGGKTVLHCFLHDLYNGQQLRPEKLQAWRALRGRYGNRDESRVDRGTLLAPPEPSTSPAQGGRGAAMRAATPMHSIGQTPITSNASALISRGTGRSQTASTPTEPVS